MDICKLCGKPYEHTLRFGFHNGSKYCLHDEKRALDHSAFTQGEEKRIINKLGRDELAVKGHDGHIRILGRKGTPSNRPPIRER